MKRSFIIFISCLLISISTRAQNGTYLEFKVSSTKGMTGSMKTYCSTTGSRSEMQMNIPQMPGGGIKVVSIIKNDQPNTMILLDEKTKTYSETPVKESATNNAPDCTVAVIGKEKIGSYMCTHASVTENNKTNEFWLTTEITDYNNYMSFRKGNKYTGSESMFSALANKGVTGFPVKTMTRDERGGDITIELVKLEKQMINADQLAIPADYTKKTIPAVQGAPSIDINKLQNMTPEERQKYAEELKKQYGK